MKKYFVTFNRKGTRFGFSVLARNEQVARNKAVRRTQFEGKDITVSHADIESVRYEGFYLARRFFAVES